MQKFLQLVEVVGSSCSGCMNVEVLKDDSGKVSVSRNLEDGKSPASDQRPSRIALQKEP